DQLVGISVDRFGVLVGFCQFYFFISFFISFPIHRQFRGRAFTVSNAVYDAVFAHGPSWIADLVRVFGMGIGVVALYSGIFAGGNQCIRCLVSASAASRLGRQYERFAKCHCTQLFGV